MSSTTITPHLFEAFLKCDTKCWLRSNNEPATGNTYADWFQARSNSYRIESVKQMLETIPQTERVLSPDMTKLKTASWRLATAPLVRTLDSPSLEISKSGDQAAQALGYELSTIDPKSTNQRQLATAVRRDKTQHQWSATSCLHAVERIPSEGRGKPEQFIPIRFIFTNKLGKDDKLLLGFDALILSQVLGREVNLGKIVHGDDHATLAVKTSGISGEVRKHLDTITTLLGSLTPPDLILNRHCTECEFQGRCRKIATEKDDLSLLAGMTDSERKKFRNKGIFTVTQLSYTFRPRRRPKRLRNKRDKYYHSLKALAIREEKIHIIGRPELKIVGTPVYLDVEGIPDRDFYYLIGVRVGSGEFEIQHHLWADAAEGEERVWRELLAILESIENPVLVHYGGFEKTFWKRMCERYGGPSEGSKAVNAMSSGINLVQFFFAQIYFPTYSNQLKEIAAWRGFSWSDSSLSGANSIVCRSEWEASGDPLSKQRLIAYNADDCKALEILTCFASDISQAESPGTMQSAKGFIYVEKLKPLKRFNLINRDGAALPEFKEINKAAYWDYQRQRVYVRSSKVIKRDSQRKSKGKTRILPIQSTIEYPPPTVCPGCGGVDFYLRGKTILRTYDVKFMRSGVKGLVKRQVWPRYHCASCKRLVRLDGTHVFTLRKYGLRLRAYAVTQLLELRISGIKVAKSLNRILNFDLTGSLVSNFKSDFAKMYGDTVKGLINRIVKGSLVHADETQAPVVGKSAHVWVLSSLEEVIYIYNDSREGEMIWSLLENFRGVLVSDFYSVYDSIDCPQQKCLIHLIRDINDDLHKYPFDEDLRKIAQAFVRLLEPIVKTIDKRGLKKHFLSRYVVPIEKYYSWLAKAKFTSEASVGYQKRFAKYRDKLFTFVTHDNVPWNNNNAENAIRAFGEIRDIIKGVTTEKGLREYLILLSICETCKRRGISFIDFLCSGEIDFERFADAKFRPPKRVARQPMSGPAAPPPRILAQSAAPSEPESAAGQLPSREQLYAQNEKELMQRELDAWSRFTCPGRFPWPEIVDPLLRLERYDGMPNGGALAALPALVESGLASVDQLFPMTIERSMQEIAMTLISLASISRMLSIEALQARAPPGWQRILCAKRLPDNQIVADLIRLICSVPDNVARWNANCANRFVAKMSEFDALLSVNDYRRIYANGEKVDSRSDSARRMLLARCRVAPWAHSLEGSPFFFVGGSLSRETRAWLSDRIFSRSHGELSNLRMGGMLPMPLDERPFTVIFGAGGVFPDFFARLFRMGHHVLSHLPSGESPWPDAEFTSQDVNLMNGKLVRLQFAERALPLAEGASFRESRCRMADNRQIVVICSNPGLDLKELASNILAVFNADCFLDYLKTHSALDGLCEGIVDPIEERAKTESNAVRPGSFRPFRGHHSVREFVNAIKLVSFRAENMIAQIIRERVSQPDKATFMLQDLLSSPADLIPDLRHQSLTIRLRPQVRDGYKEPLRHLCTELNLTETIFPSSDLRLVYEVGSPV